MHAHDRQILRIIPRTVTKRLETDSKRVRVKPTRSGWGSRAKSGSKESGPIVLDAGEVAGDDSGNGRIPDGGGQRVHRSGYGDGDRRWSESTRKSLAGNDGELE